MMIQHHKCIVGCCSACTKPAKLRQALLCERPCQGRCCTKTTSAFRLRQSQPASYSSPAEEPTQHDFGRYQVLKSASMLRELCVQLELLRVQLTHLQLVCQVKCRRCKDPVNHGVQVGLVESRVDGSPSHTPLISSSHCKAISKQEL